MGRLFSALQVFVYIDICVPSCRIIVGFMQHACNESDFYFCEIYELSHGIL